MKIYTQPSVYLLSKQQIVESELARFLDDHGLTWRPTADHPAEVVAEVAGRVCYWSFETPRPGGNAAYLERIKQQAHGSVLEHAVFTFLICGVSRSFSHELVRHRAGTAFSQLSQRYVDESVAEYVEPDVIARDPELHALWVQTVAASHDAYVKLADALAVKARTGGAADLMLSPNATTTEVRKACRQAARSVLPNATETKLTFTVNARALRHFIEQRASAAADPEIRAVASELYHWALTHARNLFSDYAVEPLPDGSGELTTLYRKV